MAPPFQFTVFDLMIVMIGVAGGLAGGTWMPSDIFAAILGMVTLLGLVLIHFFPPESHFARLLWGTLVLAYVGRLGSFLFPSSQPCSFHLPSKVVVSTLRPSPDSHL